MPGRPERTRHRTRPAGPRPHLLHEGGSMTIREDRLQDLIDEYSPSDVVYPDMDVEDFLLIEQNRDTEEFYFTHHKSAEEAGEYQTDQEDPSWEPVKLVNLS